MVDDVAQQNNSYFSSVYSDSQTNDSYEQVILMNCSKRSKSPTVIGLLKLFLTETVNAVIKSTVHFTNSCHF